MPEISKFTSNIPPFPKCVRRVMSMLRDPRIQLTKVAEIVSLDQGFAGKVLRMANSAYFGLPRQVYDVTEALVLLGFANVKSVLVSASASHVLCCGVESYGLLEGRLWEHSVGTAYGTQMLSRKVNMRVYSLGFSAGLLHDVGKVAIDRSLSSQDRTRFWRLQRDDGEAYAERSLVGFTHAEVGGEICRRWGLPPAIVDAVTFHHNPAGCKPSSDLAGIVAAANLCSKALLAGDGGITVADVASGPPGIYIPDAVTLERLAEELPAIVATSGQLLQGVTEIRDLESIGRKDAPFARKEVPASESSAGRELTPKGSGLRDPEA
jgi:putative nucleotidyltransferase with HDIG domain